MASKFDPASLFRLCSIPQIGSQRIRRLLQHFGAPDNVLSASVRQLVQVSGIDQSLAAQIQKGGDPEFASEQVRRMKATKTSLTSYWDEIYPLRLKKIPDPPIMLFVRGHGEVLSNQCIAIVGTRIPSTFGKIMAEQLARELLNKNLAIVSGLARGIDTIAHKAVVQMGGATIAVLGSGVDQIYPLENKGLADKICEQGAVISEFPMGAKPDAPHFPRRNRIISGLSLGTVVIEAGERSGALITADFALEQNREVFAVPGNANSPKSIGCNKLIQQGAKLVLNADDIIEELEGQLDFFSDSQKKQNIVLSGLEKLVFDQLSANEPRHIDKIAAECKTPTSKVLGALLALELQGIVKQLIGKNFIASV